jgi:hydroxymethylglutaryl-CoA lyase
MQKLIKSSTPKVKIYEMFMRDGLQSLNKVYPIETKLAFFNLLNSCNFHCIEVGSTTSPKLLPQMANSFELYKNAKKNPMTKYTILVPSITKINETIGNNVNSFGLVCSVSETFAQKNLKKSSKETFNNVIQQMDIITQNVINPHIRVYLSCSFGSPWENFNNEYLENLNVFIMELLEYSKYNELNNEKFDIVVSDTVGLSSEKRTNEILKMLQFSVDNDKMDYLAMHIHSKENGFTKIINSCIDNKIFKFDSSMCGIGGCPFAEDEAFGNISTTKLINLLQSLGFCKNYNLNTLNYCEKELNKILDS